MKKNQVITIARSFGSGGREIGQKLATALGFEFYDRELIQLAREKTGMDEKLLDSADEKILNRLIDPYALAGGLTDNTNEKLFRAESRIIQDLAEKGNCVIVGRLADWVLRYEEDVLDIYITAPFYDRVKRIEQTQNVDATTATKMVKKMDKYRKGYYSYFTDWEWDGLEGRDLIINSSLKGIDGTVDLLKKVVEDL